MNLKILVIGGAGTLGQLICREILRIFDEDVHVFVGDYQAERCQNVVRTLGEQAYPQIIDACDVTSIRSGIQGKDAVIVALNQEEPLIQEACLSAEISCVDVTVCPELVAKVKRVIAKAATVDSPVLMYAGFFPGISGLLAKELMKQFDAVDELHVSLIFHQNANSGVSGLVQMARSLTQPVTYHIDGRRQELPGLSKTKTFRFPEPFGKRKARIMFYGERDVLTEKLQIQNINYWAAWQVKWMGTIMFFLQQIGLLSLLQGNRKLLAALFHHDSQKPENTALIIEASGPAQGRTQIKALSMTTFSDYGTTAMASVAMTKILLQKKAAGLVFPIDIMDISNVVQEMNCKEVCLSSPTTAPS